jgi:glycosyltransferase involved in cell wall biosynthesis
VSLKKAILLSTYNGQDFVLNTIESILNQLTNNEHLYIRDDGSTDDTKNLLNLFSSHDNITLSFGLNIGVNKSYGKLLEHALCSDSEIFFFADQDDLWNSKKISTFSACMGLNPKNDLFFSDCYVKRIKKTNVNYYSPMIPINEINALMENRIMGTLCSVNRKLANKLLPILKDTNTLYDVWLSYFVAKSQVTYFHIPSPLITYTIHKNNAVSHKTKRGRSSSALKMIRSGLHPDLIMSISEVATQEKNGRGNVITLNRALTKQDKMQKNLKLVIGLPRFRRNGIDNAIFKIAAIISSRRFKL